MPAPKRKPQRKKSFKSAKRNFQRRTGTAIEQVQRAEEEQARRNAQRSLQSGKRPSSNLIPRGPVPVLEKTKKRKI